MQLYDALFAFTSSAVVVLNRALAIAELHGAAAGLDAMPDPKADARLSEYQPYWAARAELLAKTGANDEARHAYKIAIGLERDPAVPPLSAAATSGLGVIESHPMRCACGRLSVRIVRMI